MALRALSRGDAGSGVPGEAVADQRAADPRSRYGRTEGDRRHGHRKGEANLRREGHLLGAAEVAAVSRSRRQHGPAALSPHKPDRFMDRRIDIAISIAFVFFG